MNEKPAKDDNKKSAPKFRRRAEARPDEVLDAALDLFIEKGFSATRVEEIAKRAGLSKGTVYLYFPSKVALLKAIVQRAITPVADTAMHHILSFEGNPADALRVVMRGLGQRFHDPRLLAIPKLIIREATVSPEIADIYRTEVLDRALPLMRQVITKGIADGYFRPVDPDLTVRSIVGPMLVHVMLSEVFGITPEDGLSMERLIDNHLIVLLDGLSLNKDV